MDLTHSAWTDSFGTPQPANPYLQRAISKVNAHGEGIWNTLDRVPNLEPDVARAVLGEFLELACLAQHAGNIQIGRYGIASLPRRWVLLHVEAAAEPMLCSGDEWAYRRLLEVYRYLDAGLLRKLAMRAIENADPDIQEVGREFLDLPRLPE